MTEQHYYVHAYRQQVQGKVLDHNGDLGYDYDECVDVANGWARYIGIGESYGNANQLNYSTDCEWIPNGPKNHPVPGDIVIWTGYPADRQYGHVAVALHGCTSMKLRCLSQNWPDGAPCGVVIFSYEGVSGWWHPRKLGPKGA